jgi:hypothetical protein
LNEADHLPCAVKTHVTTAVLAAVLLAGMLAATTTQRRQLAVLREEARAVGAISPSSMGEAVPTAPSESLTAAPGLTPPLTAAELRELLTLRGQVAELRQAKLRLEAVRAENEHLRTALDQADQPGPDGTTSPDAYLAASRAKFSGYASPRDTLQSFLWAARSRDTNAFFQVLTPDSMAKLTAELARQGQGQGVLAQLGKIPGFRVKTLAEKPDGTAEAEVQFDPDSVMDSEKLSLERINGEWKLKFP